MKRRTFTRLLALGAVSAGLSLPFAAAARWDGDAIEVEVINDRGREFRQYPAGSRGRGDGTTTRVFVEARSDRNYAIRVRNNSDRRLGLVIAVDGRNILSGSRSELANDERMYVLEPDESGVYEGWRTGKNQVNRFYFTEPGDSYAAAFNDRSAMGVIAVAAYPERRRRPLAYDGGASVDAPAAGSYGGRGGTGGAGGAGVGTGYGESEWSPSRKVEFEPESRAIARYFLKYEWPETLCREHGIGCDGERRPPRPNRFWPEGEGGYAPPPPR